MTSTGQRGRLLRTWAGLATLLVMLLVMAAAAVAVSRSSLAAAQQERLDERRRLVGQIAAFATDAYDPGQLATAAFRTPFPQDDPALAARLLQRFRTTAIGDPTALAAVVRRDGTMLAVSPAGKASPLADVGDAWDVALAGKPARTDAFLYDGRPAWATAVPVGFGKPWGALIVVQHSASTSAQLFMQKVGTLRTGDGGLFWLDRQGRTQMSWDPARIDQVVADPQDLAARPLGRVVTTTTGEGAREVTTVSMRTAQGVTVGFEQRTEALFSDLRVEQRRRDLTLLGVFAIAVLGLLVSFVRRVRAVRANRARLDALLRNAQDLVLVAGRDGTLTFVSPAISQLLGHQASAWLGRSLLDLAPGRDADRLRELLANPSGGDSPCDVRLTTSSGGHRWFDVEAGDHSANPDVRGILLTCREIGHRKALQEELVQQARHDALTGLPNRTVLTEQLDEQLAGGSLGSPALLFVDLDRFKQVNDEWGHAAGDAVLCTVADRMVDILGPEDVVCRFGGDEFGVVLAGADEGRAVEVARRICAAVAEPVMLANGVRAEVGASVGIALPGPDDDAETLLRVADQAMYRAKQQGRGGYVVHLPTTRGPATGLPAPAPDAEPPGAVPAAEPPAVETQVAGPSPGPAGRAGRPAAGTPSPAASESPLPIRGTASVRAEGHRLLAFAPLVAAVVAIVAVAGVGVWQTNQAQLTAERQRTAERLRMTEGVAEYATILANPQRFLTPVNAAPWALDGSVVDSLVLQAIVASDLGGEGALVRLHGVDGGVLASAGDVPPPGIAVGDRAWRSALAGRVGYVPLVENEGRFYGCYAIPILRGNRPGAVVVVAQLLTESRAQRLLETLGSLGFGEGGISVVARSGLTVNSWNGALIGRRLLDPEVVPALPAQRATVLDGPADQVTLAASITSTRDIDPKAAVFQQPQAAFFGDLRTGQTARDLTLLAVVLLAVMLLCALTWLRERALRSSERRLDALLRHAHDIVAVLDGGTATFVSSAMTGLLGHEPATWLRRPWQDLVHPDDVQRLARHVRSSLGTARDIRLRHADGSYRWFDVASADLRDVRALGGFVITAHEVGERKRLQAELAHNASHDALTGLLNRATFTHRLRDLVATNAAAAYTVLFIDLDRFKPVNDTFGHDVGDVVLRAVAERIQRCVPRDGVLCRLGGDEFAVLLTGADADLAPQVADAVLRRLREPVPLPAGSAAAVVRIDSTIGIAHSSAGQDPADVLKQADHAMYRGKQGGRGRYAVHS